MEEKPLFKFKKASKSIGGFDVNSKDEHDLLIKKEYQDFTKFTHIHKMWNIVETPDEYDTDEDGGNITKRGKKATPAYQVTSGFIKDGNHIVTYQKTHGSMNYTTAHKSYINFLETWINERGFTKDVDNYQDGIAVVPKYFVNEKTSMEEVVAQGMPKSQTSTSNKKFKILNLLKGAGLSTDPNNNIQIQP